jgi:DNA-binding NtrC family response regulator
MAHKRILVVDDDRDMVQTLCEILEMHGWETVRAYDGQAAVGLAIEHSVDVVLMDVRMPRLDGVAALKAIKALRPLTRTVLMTAYASNDLLAKAESEGATRIVRKPLEIPALLGVLDQALQRARSVLVVDDDPNYLRTLCDVLAERGIATLPAGTLDEALARLREDAPGVVLLDLKLDDVNPLTSIRAIKSANPFVLLILYSGHDAMLADTMAEAPSGLVHAVFSKPLPIDELLEVIATT